MGIMGNIEFRRRTAGLTQCELARLARVAQSDVSRAESGLAAAGIVAKIVAALDRFRAIPSHPSGPAEVEHVAAAVGA